MSDCIILKTNLEQYNSKIFYEEVLRKDSGLKYIEHFRSVYKILDGIRIVLITIIFSFVILAGATEIFLRFMPGLKSFPWIDEILRYMNIWLVFLGASIAVKEGSHLVMEFLVHKLLPARGIAVLSRITMTITLVTLGIIFYVGLKRTLSMTHVIIQAFPITISLFYLAIPIGCAYMIMDYVLIMICGAHPFHTPTKEAL